MSPWAGPAGSVAGALGHHSVKQGARQLWEKGVSDGREREPFPLPQLATTYRDDQLPRSRKSLRRLAGRLSVNERINRVSEALNVLAAGGSRRGAAVPATKAPPLSAISPGARCGQREVLQCVREAVLADPVPRAADMLRGEVALRELLKTRGEGYACERGALARYFGGGPSLPGGRVGAVPLESLLPESWQQRLRPDQLLRAPSDCRARQAELQLEEPFFDENLREDPRAYAEFLASMHKAGMLEWEVEILNECAPFFVWKDEGSLRCIFDCRLANEAFHQAPDCHLSSSERLADMECPVSETLYGSGYDVRDYYHIIKLPLWLSSHFGLPPVNSALLQEACRAAGVEPPALSLRQETVRGALGTLPMGWKWAVALAQCVHETLVAEEVDSESILADRKFAPQFGPKSSDSPRILAYIDDGSVMSTNQQRAQELHDRLSARWNEKGFLLHEGKGHAAVDHWEKVGVEVCGRTGRVSPKGCRRWRLEQGALELLRRPTSCGKELEIVVSHFTTMFLLRRPLLSVFHFCYEWIQKAPKRRSALPREVREEIKTAIDLLPFCFSDVKVPYSDWVYCSDSSETHYAVMRSCQPLALIRSAYRWHERWRFQEDGIHVVPPGGPAHPHDALEKLRTQLGLSGSSGDVLGWIKGGFGPTREGWQHRPDLKGVKRALEVFSGCGNWSKALRAHGFEVRAFDYCNDSQDDILDDRVFLELMSEVLSGQLSAMHFGTPCRSWSRARLPRLRTLSYISSGVPGLCPRERKIVEEGNELLRRSLILLRLGCLCGLAVSLENPFSSMMWSHPEVQKWIR